MNDFERERRQIQRYKEQYPPGTRIMLLHMEKERYPIPDDTRGTVTYVDDVGSLFCDFDNGRSFALLPDADSFRKLTDEELAEEQTADMDEDESDPIMGM